MWVGYWNLLHFPYLLSKSIFASFLTCDLRHFAAEFVFSIAIGFLPIVFFFFSLQNFSIADQSYFR